MSSIAHGVSLHISRYLENATRSLWALLGLIKPLIPELKNDPANCYGRAIPNLVSPRSSVTYPVFVIAEHFSKCLPISNYIRKYEIYIKNNMHNEKNA